MADFRCAHVRDMLPEWFNVQLVESDMAQPVLEIYAFLEHLDHLDLGMAFSLDHLDHLDCGPLAFSIISIISNMASNIVWSFRGLKQHVLQSLCQSVPILGLQHIICSYLCKIGVLRLCRAQFGTKRLPTHRVC